MIVLILGNRISLIFYHYQRRCTHSRLKGNKLATDMALSVKMFFQFASQREIFKAMIEALP